MSVAVESVPRILLVDSEPTWGRKTETILEKHGKYQVESFTNIGSALNSSYIDDFDLVLINAALAFGENISEEDMFNFKKIIRRYPDKVLVISNVRSISTAIEVFKMGADYAEKPFEPSRVIELVASRIQEVYEATG
jgi:DNA-binding NtrC family response regulator